MNGHIPSHRWPVSRVQELQALRGDHFERISPDVLRLDYMLVPQRSRRRPISWQRLLLLAASVLLFWFGVALLLGWRPVS